MLGKTRQDVFVHNKTPRPTRCIGKACSHFKTRSEKQEKTYLCITRGQDLQDAFERHAPISRRVQKNKTRHIRAKQDAMTYKRNSNGTLPFQDVLGKTRQDIFVHNKTPRPTRRIPTARFHFKTCWEKRDDDFVHNKTPRPTRRIPTARSHFKTCWEKQDKTYLCKIKRQDLQDALERHAPISRRQDLQDAFERHAPISRRVQKNKTRRVRA